MISVTWAKIPTLSAGLFCVIVKQGDSEAQTRILRLRRQELYDALEAHDLDWANFSNAVVSIRATGFCYNSARSHIFVQ